MNPSGTSVVSVIEEVEGDVLNDLPESLKPENCNVVAIVPVLGEVKEITGQNLLAELIQQLKTIRHVTSIYVFSKCVSAKAMAQHLEVNFIARPQWLQYAFAEIEHSGNYPDVILYANYLYPFRPKNLFDELIQDLQYQGPRHGFPGLR